MPVPATPSTAANTPPVDRAAVRKGRAMMAARRAEAAHTRFVSIAKIALPITAGLVVASVAVWPLVKENTATRLLTLESGQLEMVDARYAGTDKHNRPFEIRANRALQSSQTGPAGKGVDLINPEADISTADGDWMSMSAQQGHYAQEGGILDLSGQVTLFHDQGYEFRTDEAHIDTKAGTAWGDRPISGQGLFGTLQASGFRIANEGRTLIFTGKARLSLPASAFQSEKR